jgi:hypothetical protein
MLKVGPILFLSLGAIGCSGKLEGVSGGQMTAVSDDSGPLNSIDGAGSTDRDASAEDGSEEEVPSWASCVSPDQCVVVARACCPSCAVPELADVIGLRRGATNDPRECSSECPPTGGLCLPLTNANLGVQCSGGQCEAFDVRALPQLSACQSASDCRLRAGAQCCPTVSDILDPDVWIAIRTDADLRSLVCASDAVCPNPDPSPPVGMGTACYKGTCWPVQN